MPRLSLTLAALVVAVGVAAAAPPTDEARKAARGHYEQAVSRFNNGEYGPAADEFLATYKLVPQPALLYNAAQAYRLGNDREHAVEQYRAFLQAEPSARQRGDVEKRIAELTGKAAPPPPDMSAPAKATTTTTTSGKGGSDRLQAVADVIKQNRAGFRACFDKWSKAHAGVDGRVTLTFYLDPDGNLDQANADEKGFSAPDVAGCIEEHARSLKYPKSPSGKFTRFTYPFDFKAAR